MRKFNYLLGVVLIGSVLLSGIHSAQAMESDYYYDGMKPATKQIAYPIVKSYPNSKTFMKAIPNRYTKYAAIGRIANKNGWAGPEYETMGSGFVIDDHTILTNAHVIDDEHGKATAPKYLTFEMNRNEADIPHKFAVTKVVKVPYADVALVHTKVKLTDYVKPMKLATDNQIARLKQGQVLFSVGYPFDGKIYEKRYFNRALFIMRTANQTEFVMKDKFRAGASGSPLFDSKMRVYGLRTYGYDLYGEYDTPYAKAEYSGAEALYGYTGQYVLDHMY
ncbi:trypsin-like serine peptidase [Macrococcus epidermidis]|uniref:trypsin-like serine peptidase n=1 Tax=Macrococcus epidermidis TaxID=1902580 RepID=UPI0020B81C53|nr:serine protease [Macrococcus epidermidis]UTH15975.1 trypsin-like peptidase domain-containing protein [Macrococcus epidermidis]